MRLEDVVSDPSTLDATRLIVDEIAARGGRSALVGGCVRDGLLGRPVTDVDLEVYGLEPDEVRAAVSARHRVRAVGESFAVLKVDGLDIDVSLPRRERSTGAGHADFVVDADPHMGAVEAASRRDFTINAMSLDMATGDLIDPFGGQADLDRGILRHTGPAFVEDPLRVLRGMQFAARFEATMAPETIALCRTLSPADLSAERFWGEWKKMILLGRKPSMGLDILDQTGWLDHLPELAALKGCQQDPEWHPEGDVWTHTKHVMDMFARERMASLRTDEADDLVVGLAALCHDLGKPSTTEFVDGRWRSHHHEVGGEEPTREFLQGMRTPQDVVSQVVALVRDHLAPAQFHQRGAGDGAIRRLAGRVGRIDLLIRVAKADHFGRPPLPAEHFPAGDWLAQRAAQLAVADSKPGPLVLGRHLIDDLGLEPGPDFRRILDACFEAQLDGQFTDLEGGIAVARSQLST
ncbi:MAG: tRNA nucleotidyltransferase (CCA-adding enzyme) [Candidatus Poriferisodalaceae bacterium]|jgi:tRNA nucleotidyltransferase (CCA-adding enzyme)